MKKTIAMLMILALAFTTFSFERAIESYAATGDTYSNDFSSSSSLDDFNAYFIASPSANTAGISEDVSAHWTVSDGILTRVNDINNNWSGNNVAILTLKQKYQNFELTVDMRHPTDFPNAGIAFDRQFENKQYSTDGAAVWIDSIGQPTLWGAATGGYYQAPAISGYQKGVFNTLKIRVTGRQFELYFNDMLCQSFTLSPSSRGYGSTPASATSFDEGFISLISFGASVEYKNLIVRNLDGAVYSNTFDNMDNLNAFDPYYISSISSNPAGVSESAAAHWTIENGSLKRINDISSGSTDRVSILSFRNAEFQNFDLTVDYIQGANWSWPVIGFARQEENLPFTATGGGAFVQQQGLITLWGTNGLSGPSTGTLLSSYNKSAWNTLRVKRVGISITLFIDNIQVYSYTLGSDFPAGGSIALLVCDNTAYFDNLSIVNLNMSGNPTAINYENTAYKNQLSNGDLMNDFISSYVASPPASPAGVVEELSSHWKFSDGGIGRINDLSGSSTDRAAILTLNNKKFKNFEASYSVKAGTDSVFWPVFAFGQKNIGTYFLSDGVGVFIQNSGKPTVWGSSPVSGPYEVSAISGYDPSGWHKVVVRLVGHELKVFVDGTLRQTQTLNSEFDSEGYISLQSINNGCTFKKLSIKNLDENGDLKPITFINYCISDDGAYLSNIQPGWTAAEFLSGVSRNALTEVTLTTQTGTVLSLNDTIGTGTKALLKVNGSLSKTLTIILVGDLNGDGNITNDDLTVLRNCLLENIPSSSILTQAGDLYLEGTITINGMVGLMSYLDGSGTISQNRI